MKKKTLTLILKYKKELEVCLSLLTLLMKPVKVTLHPVVEARVRRERKGRRQKEDGFVTF